MKTKRILILAAFFISSACAWSSIQAVPQNGDPIQVIRQRFGQINGNLARYRKVKKELSGFSAEGGQMVAYFHGPSIVKIATTYFGEMGKATEEYYYWEGKLIFVFRTDHQYDKPLSGKVVQKTENRFYFKGDKLIRWLDENSKQVAENNDYQEKQNEYLKNSKELTAGARSAKSTIEASP